MTEEQAALRLSALGNPTRLRLFRLLVRAGRDGLNVGDLQRLLGVPASTLAHHIAALVKADLLLQERRGREVICAANYEVMNGLVAYLTEQCCAGVAIAEDALASEPG
jgi:ArsR family transcriptional regulator, arsenate/arsenite/antimonite-responsive transcriptional repressor